MTETVEKKKGNLHQNTFGNTPAAIYLVELLNQINNPKLTRKVSGYISNFSGGISQLIKAHDAGILTHQTFHNYLNLTRQQVRQQLEEVSEILFFDVASGDKIDLDAFEAYGWHDRDPSRFSGQLEATCIEIFTPRTPAGDIDFSHEMFSSKEKFRKGLNLIIPELVACIIKGRIRSAERIATGLQRDYRNRQRQTPSGQTVPRKKISEGQDTITPELLIERSKAKLAKRNKPDTLY